MGDRAARRLYPGLHGLQILGVKDGQGFGRHGVGGEAAVQPFAERRIGGSVVLEAPAERLGVEGLVRRQIRRGQFEIIQLAVFAHGDSPREMETDACTTADSAQTCKWFANAGVGP
ncbi:hypothetical protein D3C73_1184590 [compost metagenome]